MKGGGRSVVTAEERDKELKTTGTGREGINKPSLNWTDEDLTQLARQGVSSENSDKRRSGGASDCRGPTHCGPCRSAAPPRGPSGSELRFNCSLRDKCISHHGTRYR